MGTSKALPYKAPKGFSKRQKNFFGAGMFKKKPKRRK